MGEASEYARPSPVLAVEQLRLHLRLRTTYPVGDEVYYCLSKDRTGGVDVLANKRLRCLTAVLLADEVEYFLFLTDPDGYSSVEVSTEDDLQPLPPVNIRWASFSQRS